MSLFKSGVFRLHSGEVSDFFIDCDSLADDDWKALAEIISQRCKFKDVWGIPEGGMKLRDYLSLHCTDDDSLPTLIVDDVLTTGTSMERARNIAEGNVIGWVVFARDKCPEWVRAVCQVNI